MHRRSDQTARMKPPSPRSLTEQELQALDKAELIDIVVRQQALQQREAEPTIQSSKSAFEPPSEPPSETEMVSGEKNSFGRSPAPRSTLPLPKVLTSLPLWLTLVGSLFLHGLVLLVPIASPPEEEATEEEISTELIIPMTPLPARSPEPSPQPSVVESPPPEPPPPAQPSPQPEPPAVVVQPPPLEPEPQPPTPEPQPPEAEPEPQEPEPQEPEPQEPEPQPEQAEVEADTPATPADIAGVPLEAAWQVLEQPIAQGVNDAQWYANPEGQVREDIRGLVEIPEANFEEFFVAYRQQLTAAGFTIRAEGAYQGTPIYRLTSQTSEEPLFLTLETLEEGSILMAIWDKYPW